MRATALPAPGGEDQLRALASRVFAQQLDRDKPLWEIYLVEGLEGGRFALLSKTHHALVDGVSGVDIFSVLFDTSAQPAAPPDPGRRWLPAPAPSGAQLLGEALLERATVPGELARSSAPCSGGRARSPTGSPGPRTASGRWHGRGSTRRRPARYNRTIGPHRRFTWVRTELADIKAIKNELGGTVNDVVLSTVAGALGRHLRRRGQRTDGLELKAMVPVSVRAEDERGALGNKVAAMMAPLPGVVPGARGAAGDRARADGRAQGERTGAGRAGADGPDRLRAPTVMAQASRLMGRQRMFNLVVTNVPGPQFPLYLMGRKATDPFPMVPLAKGQGLGVAIMSYDGKMNFGLVGDYDVMYDLDDLAGDLYASLEELAAAAGVTLATDAPQIAGVP